MHYISHLSKDRTLKKLVDRYEPFILKKNKNICLRLCASIMSQQLSTKVADVIFKRFLNLFGAKQPTPEQILAVPAPVLRSIGLSNAKVSYVHNVARFAVENGMDHKKFSGMSDEEVITYLTSIKGVGRWTAEMLLMFTLGREDISPLDDFGAAQALIKLYGLKTSDKKKLRQYMNKIASAWSPYRTYAYLYLWKSRDDSEKEKK
ncbi:MAG: DNA-3-methyladenine glycosylase 2 family protein [Chitinophagales bacterium]